VKPDMTHTCVTHSEHVCHGHHREKEFQRNKT